MSNRLLVCYTDSYARRAVEREAERGVSLHNIICNFDLLTDVNSWLIQFFYLSNCESTNHPSTQPPTHSPIQPFIRPSVHSSIRPSIHPSTHPFTHPLIDPLSSIDYPTIHRCIFHIFMLQFSMNLMCVNKILGCLIDKSFCQRWAEVGYPAVLSAKWIVLCRRMVQYQSWCLLQLRTGWFTLLCDVWNASEFKCSVRHHELSKRFHSVCFDWQRTVVQLSANGSIAFFVFYLSHGK